MHHYHFRDASTRSPGHVYYRHCVSHERQMLIMVCASDEQVNFELCRSFQMFTGPTDALTTNARYSRHESSFGIFLIYSYHIGLLYWHAKYGKINQIHLPTLDTHVIRPLFCTIVASNIGASFSFQRCVHTLACSRVLPSLRFTWASDVDGGMCVRWASKFRAMQVLPDVYRPYITNYIDY